MKIRAVDAAGKRYSVKVQPENCILEIKDALSVLRDVPSASLALEFRGQILRDSDSVADVNLVDRSTLRLLEPSPRASSSASSQPCQARALAEALAASADKAPPRAQGCSYDVASQRWLSAEQVRQLPSERHMMLLRAEFQVRKARNSNSNCRRCGRKLEKGSVQIGFPSTGKDNKKAAFTVWVHVHCARKEERLVELARSGSKRVVAEQVLGFDVLKEEEMRKLLEDLTSKGAAVEAPAEPPAVQQMPSRSLAPHAAQSASLREPLLPFQAEGLGWMLSQEADAARRGGILADEMGMGKTLQTIALLLESPEKGPSLIVVPPTSISQWCGEFKRFCQPGKLEVRCYHGTGASNDTLFQATKQDRQLVVVTTYSTLERAYRKELERLKIPCEWCGKRCMPDGLEQHHRVCKALPALLRKRFRRQCEGLMQKRRRLAAADVSVSDDGEGELKDECDADDPFLAKDAAEPEVEDASTSSEGWGEEDYETWRASLRAGGEEVKREPELERFRIEDESAAGAESTKVLKEENDEDKDVKLEDTEVKEELDDEGRKRRPADVEQTADDPETKIDLSNSPLFQKHWARVVLDEAHRIKAHSSGTAQAAFNLRADRARWCLSGTPIQNRVGELYSMVRFLRFYPYGYFRCAKRHCQCECCILRCKPGSQECSRCGHSRLLHRSVFATDISTPIRQYGFLGEGRKAMEKLRLEVLQSLLLRRTKSERADDVKLPGLSSKVCKIELRPWERRFYESVRLADQPKYDEYVRRGTVMKNFAHVFSIILRQRQAADHPHLVKHAAAQAGEGESFCSLCLSNVAEDAERTDLKCGHSFHRCCLDGYSEEVPLTGRTTDCPSCAVLKVHGGRAEPAAGAADSLSQRTKQSNSRVRMSGKIEAMVEELQAIRAADPENKVLIFSQFTRFLEIIGWRLEELGWSTAKLFGSVDLDERSQIIDRFQKGRDLNVLLISLKVGGEGLNLQAANYVFLMDPWWNPAAEQQAMQRAHRIGQKRHVHVLRFVASSTIEEKILELQEKKQLTFDGTVGGSNDALMKLTGEDIQLLFSQ